MLLWVFWEVCAVLMYWALCREAAQSRTVSFVILMEWFPFPASLWVAWSLVLLRIPVMIMTLSFGKKCVSAVTPWIGVGPESRFLILIIWDMFIDTHGTNLASCSILSCSLQVLPSPSMSFQFFHWLIHLTVCRL